MMAFAVAAVIVNRPRFSVGAEEQVGRLVHDFFNLVPSSEFDFSLVHRIIGEVSFVAELRGILA